MGDLHGHREAFESRLAALAFDTRVDRVISVGDLINRGPQSLETLALIDEPWFHAVLGNHELMLLGYLGFFDSRMPGSRDFAARKGPWVVDALARHRARLMRLAERVAELPLALHVEDPSPFNVMHGDLQPLGSRQSHLFRQQTIAVHAAEQLATSRAHVAEVLAAELRDLDYGGQPVRVSESPKGRLPLTYVGHSPMPRVTVHQSYVYVDQGVRQSGRKSRNTAPTVLDHQRFSFWLDGAARAPDVGASPHERHDGDHPRCHETVA